MDKKKTGGSWSFMQDYEFVDASADQAAGQQTDPMVVIQNNQAIELHTGKGFLRPSEDLNLDDLVVIQTSQGPLVMVDEQRFSSGYKIVHTKYEDIPELRNTSSEI